VTADLKRSASTSIAAASTSGDPATTTEQLFTAWQADRDHRLDAIMLASTRDIVAQLNRRARTHRLHHTSPGRRSSWPTETVHPPAM
jgi:hypothetical protein